METLVSQYQIPMFRDPDHLHLNFLKPPACALKKPRKPRAKKPGAFFFVRHPQHLNRLTFLHPLSKLTGTPCDILRL